MTTPPTGDFDSSLNEMLTRGVQEERSRKLPEIYHAELVTGVESAKQISNLDTIFDFDRATYDTNIIVAINVAALNLALDDPSIEHMNNEDVEMIVSDIVDKRMEKESQAMAIIAHYVSADIQGLTLPVDAITLVTAHLHALDVDDSEKWDKFVRAILPGQDADIDEVERLTIKIKERATTLDIQKRSLFNALCLKIGIDLDKDEFDEDTIEIIDALEEFIIVHCVSVAQSCSKASERAAAIEEKWREYQLPESCMSLVIDAVERFSFTIKQEL